METREISIMQSKLVTIYAALLNETLQIAEISGIRWTATPLNTSKSKVPAAYADRKWFRNPQKFQNQSRRKSLLQLVQLDFFFNLNFKELHKEVTTKTRLRNKGSI